MAWIRPTVDEIYQRIKADMEARVTANVKIPRVSLLGIMAIVFAGGIHLCYGFLQWLARQLFVDTAEADSGLFRWGNILGLPRKPADFTTGEVEFNGVATTVVPANTIVVNSEGYEYTTTDNFIIGTTVSVGAVATEPGELYNTQDTELVLGSPIDDVESDVPVVSGFDNGVDQETVDAWVVRLLQRFQNPPSSGNVADYERWALGINGVGKAWCFPGEEFLGAGTVGLFLATEDLLPVSGSILTEAQTIIDVLKPIPAEVSYLTVNALPTTYYISLSPNVLDLQTAINTNLKNLHLLEAAPGGTILLSHIRSAISAAGPDDFVITDIEVDSISIGVNNIETNVPDIAVYSNVVYASL